MSSEQRSSQWYLIPTEGLIQIVIDMNKILIPIFYLYYYFNISNCMKISLPKKSTEIITQHILNTMENLSLRIGTPSVIMSIFHGFLQKNSYRNKRKDVVICGLHNLDKRNRDHLIHHMVHDLRIVPYFQKTPMLPHRY